MSFARVAMVFVVLCVLSGCSGRGDADGPELPTRELPSTTVGLPYEVSLAASGGMAPLRYGIGEVPDGFSFYTGTGMLTGPASAAGEYTLTVEVTDAAGATDSRTYALTVYAAPSITSTALPEATSGQEYEFQLSATGGQPPLRWTLAEGSLPPGMDLSMDGRLSGVPRGQGGHPLTLRVQDANGALATRSLTVELRTVEAGTSFPLEVANWNVEWFGSTSYGPTDEALQLDNVRTVIKEVGADIWGLTELVDVNQFYALKAGLTGYEGFVADDSSVVHGSTHYSSDEQKVGLLYKSGLVSVQHAEVILGSNSIDFAGRPPLRVDLRVTREGTSVDLVAIVLHMKADSTQASYEQRKAAGVALKQYLDTERPDARVIVLGDWNDDVDVSITKHSETQNYLDSPYQNFVDATATYAFITRPLSLANIGSSVGSTNVIDHQLVSNELAVSHVSNSTQVVHPDLPSYRDTTSDHYPVVSQFDFAQGVTPPAPASPVFINEFLPQPNNKPPPNSNQVDFDQAFVEVMNTGTTVADLSGWKLHDAESYSGAKPARHVFPAGTTLAPGKVYVVYSGASAVPSGATNVDYANGNDGLRFNRGVNVGSSGDTVYLVKPDGTVADSSYYKDTFQGVSYNRSPDATNTGTWERHDSVSPGLSASPGRRADGTSF